MGREIVAIGFVVIPILFNLCFALLAKTFDYPEILRQPTGHVLQKFSQGGSRLILTWWAFMLTAVAFVPISVSIPGVLESTHEPLNTIVIASGLIAGLVQFIGLSRWVFLVPFLARESETADLQRMSTIDLIFQSANRFLGVAIGEHLGYLFTGFWSVASGILLIDLDGLSQPLGIVGIVIGVLLLLCSLEFVGINEKNGWIFAAKITPFVYVMWSFWLIGLGIHIFRLT